MAAEDDILQWELDQIKKTKMVCNDYGWKNGDSNYKARLKLIQSQSVAMQKDRLAAALGAAPKSSRARGPKRCSPCSET